MHESIAKKFDERILLKMNSALKFIDAETRGGERRKISMKSLTHL